MLLHALALLGVLDGPTLAIGSSWMFQLWSKSLAMLGVLEGVALLTRSVAITFGVLDRVRGGGRSVFRQPAWASACSSSVV